MLRHTLISSVVAVAFGLLCAASDAQAQGAMDAQSQAQFDAAKKIIPGLTPDVFLGAKKEGELHLYRLSYDFKAAVFPEFQKLFPFIKITEFEATTNELLQRYAAEARSGRAVADVLMNSMVTALNDFDKENLLTRYTPTSAEHYKSGSRAGVYYPMGGIQLCNAYNTDLVKPDDAKLLETWDGITNPRWRNKAGMVRFGVGAGPNLAYYFMDTERGPAFLKSVADLRPLTFTSIPALTERLAAGGVDVMFFANEGNLQQLKNSGAPIQWVCPSPALSIFTVQMLGFRAPDPNAGKLWIEYMLSERGQELVMTTLGLAPGSSDAKDIRKVTSEPWYRKASTVYNFSWDDLTAGLKKVEADWTAVSADVPRAN